MLAEVNLFYLATIVKFEYNLETLPTFRLGLKEHETFKTVHILDLTRLRRLKFVLNVFDRISTFSPNLIQILSKLISDEVYPLNVVAN